MVEWFRHMALYHMEYTECPDMQDTTQGWRFPGDVAGEDSTDIFPVLAVVSHAGEDDGEVCGKHELLIMKGELTVIKGNYNIHEIFKGG